MNDVIITENLFDFGFTVVFKKCKSEYEIFDCYTIIDAYKKATVNHNNKCKVCKDK